MNILVLFENININSVIEMFFIIIFSYYTFMRVINIKNIKIKNILISLISGLLISIITIKIKYDIDAYYSLLFLVFITGFINFVNYKNDFIYSFLMTIISLCISYIFYIISVFLAFIPKKIFEVQNEYIGTIFIITIYLLIMNNIFNIKKIKNGFIFLKKKLGSSYYNILIINISIIILFLKVFFTDTNAAQGNKVWITMFFFSIIMFLTIKQSFDLYYKQNLLTKDLEQTKAELEEKKQEIDKLERENLEFSKSSHSLAHKQKSLEYKLEKLMKTGVDEKSKEAIKQEIQNISKEVYKEPQQIELPKTEIEAIDDMFSYMQSECIKDNIKFELQIVGNPFYMINNLISESELEILLADHIKDAIIAINYSDNTNRSILVRIGKIDNVYSLYIYDSGIEFEKEVLENLGKKPITTHADSGGTGMGFMNTFDTLNRTKASLIINEIGKPCIDNYTKVLIFKFDNKNEFIVNSYKSEVAVV